MKALTAPFTNMRTNTVIPGTKTRVTISQYDDAWTWESDTDVTDYLIRGQPNIDSEIEEGIAEFRKDNLSIDLEDQSELIRNLIETVDKYFLILIEKGFDGIADWIVIFDGIIDTFETVGKARNIISITAYSMEAELEMHPASGSASSGGANIALATAVGDLWDLSYINIPGGNRTIAGPPQVIPLCDYTGWNAREALNNIALIYGCVWKRTERDTAMFLSKDYIGGTLNLDTNLYTTNYEEYKIRAIDGVYAENSVAAISAYSTGYINGYNQEYNNQLITQNCPQNHWVADEIFSPQAENRRLFRVPGFFLLELEPLDRVNLTLRDKDGVFDETIFTQFIGSEYDDTNKITRLKLEERKERCYERFLCSEDGEYDIFGANWEAQTFTLGSVAYNQAHVLTSVWLYINRWNNPGNFTVGIRAIAAGVPVFPDLDSVTINATVELPATPIWYEFVFTGGITLNAGTQYAIVCRAPAGTAPHRVEWWYNVTPLNLYPGGARCYSSTAGAAWTCGGNADFLFEEWGQAP